MLDDEATPVDDLPRPPAGRRSARRAAGPPAPFVAPVEQPRRTIDDANPAPSTPEPAATDAASDGALVAADTPATAKRTPRRRVAKKTSQPQGPEEDAASTDVPAKSTRKRVAKRPARKTAPAQSTLDDVLIDSAEAGSTQPTSTVAEALEQLVAEAGVTEDALPEGISTIEEADEVAEASAADDATPEPTTVKAEPVQVEDAEAVGDAATTEPALGIDVPAVEEPGRRRRVRKPVASPFTPPKVLSPQETEQALAELANAIARAVEPNLPPSPAPTAANDVESADDADEVEADDIGDDEDHDDDQPRRRRRRRGGRRRRRRDHENDGDDSDIEAEADDDTSQEGGPESEDTEPDTDVESDSGADSDSDSGDFPDGIRRRRRRRRRRGDETEQAEDDPDTDVIVRVRDPRRQRTAANDAVAGIEGSTRMEAKRQRRREGRAAGRRRAPILSEAEFLSRRESVERIMAIRQHPEYNQIAVLEDGVLVEHYVDRASASSLIGNIYLGRVQNVLPSMEAAFIDIGRGRNAVLYAGEVDWDAFGDAGQGRKMEQVFKSGQSVLVQVTKDPVGAKGARLTSHISIPGRYIVYSPGGALSGISRKLPDTERQRLKGILDGLIAEESSVIVRTAAEGASEEDLVRDVNRLTAQWETIQKKVKQGSAPVLLYSEPDATVRIVRDLFTEDFTKLVVSGDESGEDTFDMIDAYVEHVAPHLKERMERWDNEHGDIFADYRVDEQIAKALERKVFLPSGGSLIIDRTEAMTVIDVNTGKFTGTGGNLEATVTSNNLEAAEEIVRQLRLRDIGGIIVIDFIDMVLPSNRELLLRRLVECLGRDRTRHQVSEVTSLGLVQLTRKKIGTGLAEAFTEPCEHCKGRGYVQYEEPVETQAPSDGGERSADNKARPQRNRGGKKKA